MIRVSFLLLAALAACAPAARAPATSVAGSVVVVVRHAEKAPLPADDPMLSEAGLRRAAALDSAVSGLPITDVVVSQLQRTRLTASVLIARVQPVVHVVPIGAAGVAAHVKAVADTVRAITGQPNHRWVVVVGHSNTVTSITEALGAPVTPALSDSQYSQFLMVRTDADQRVSFTRSAYGAADPAPAGCPTMQGRP